MAYAIMLMVRPLLASRPCLWLVLAALGIPLQAQQKYEGLMIRNIQFEPKTDLQPVDANELHDLLPLKMNQPLRMEEVRASIERLFATGAYADIQVDAEPYRDGVSILFVTKQSWFIGSVAARGRISSPPNPGQLANASDLDLGQPFSEAKLQQSVANQKRLFESNGLFVSRISPVLDWDSGSRHQQVNIRFDVESGRRARFTTPQLTGDLKMDAGRILSATKFRRWIIHTWKPMTQTRTRQALDGVRSLFQKENRLEAKVSLESMQYLADSNSALASIHIDAGPRIEVHTVGLKISQGKLHRYVPIFEEHAVDHDLLVEGARNLRDYLQSQGFFEADVQPEEQRVINDRASIDFLVNTGARHKLVFIQISGNRYFKTEAIRERMFLQTARFLQFPHGRYSENLLRRDEESIRGLYESNGFRDAKVTHRIEDNFRGRPGQIAVFLTIEEGAQSFIGELKVEGIAHLDKNAILDRLSSVAGQPFSDFNIAVDRDTILARYFQNGFPSATFEWSSKPSDKPNLVVLTYTVQEGREQFVREVLVNGYNVTRRSLIDRSLRLNPGDPLSPTAVTETQRRLYDLGVFARVEAAIQDPDGELQRKYVAYQVEEARRYSMAVGVGAELGRIGGCQTCLDAPAGATGFSPRVSFNISRNNLWGVAHSLSLRARASTLDQRVILTYSWPRFFGKENFTFLVTGLFQESRDVRTFNYRRQEASIQLNHRLNKSLTLFYRYSFRRVGVSDLKITPFLIPQLSQQVRVGIASINLVQDRRDDPVDPHKGIYNTMDLGVADKGFGSQVNFLHLLARNATYHPLGRRLVLARSTQIGEIYPFTASGDPMDAIPLAERFFGGGGTSHRGFPEDQAGPRDISTGFPVGGTALLFNQTELRFPLIGDNIGGVLYHDMGNIYSSIGNLSFRVRQHSNEDFDYMVHAVGFGVRYRTPIGPVRLDLGYSINPPYFFGFKGTQQDLLSGGVNPCAPSSPVVSQCTVQNVSHFQFFFSIGQTF